MFRELLISVLRELEDPEIANAAPAVIQAAPSTKALQDQDVARAVAAAANRRPEAVADVAGALVLAESAVAEDSRILARLVLEVSERDDEAILWAARAQIRAVLGDEAFSSWAQGRIAQVESWSDIDRWTRADLGDAFAVGLLGRAVELAANPGETAVANEDDFANVFAITSQVSEPVPVPDMKALRAAIEVGADTLESAIALECARAYTFTDEQLADLLQSATTAQKSLDDDAEPAREMQDGLAAVTIRMASQNPKFGYWKGTSTPHSAASVGSSLIAGWVDSDAYPASLALPVLTAMVTRGAKAHSSLAKALIDDWIRHPGGNDTEDVPRGETVRSMSALLPQMEDSASIAVVSSWVAALGDQDTRAFVAGLAPHILTAGAPTDWGDKAMAELVPLFQRSIDYSADATEAAALLMATGRVSLDCERELLNALGAILPYGGAHRVRALTSLSQLPWSKELSPAVVTTVTPYVEEAPEAVYWALFDLFDSRGLVDSNLTAHVDVLLEDAEPTEAMKTRANPLSRVLSLENAMELALSAESEDAMTAVATRTLDLSEADPAVAGLLHKIAVLQPPVPARSSFAYALAAADYDVYASAVRLLLADTLDVGGAGDQHLWAFITIPLRAAERAEVWAEVESRLTSSAQEASAAAIVLAATGADDELDQIVAKNIGKVMLYWISDEPAAEVAAALAASVRGGKRSRSAARSPAARNWRVSEKKAAAAAALKALR